MSIEDVARTEAQMAARLGGHGELDLLAAFRRYVDGCQTYAHCDWDAEKIKQWEEDKKFRINAYNSKRHISFSEASTYAQEQLFLRCVAGC